LILNEKTFRDHGSWFMTLEIIIILLTIVLAVYFLFRPTSKKEKDRFEDKDNWRGGF
jgi:preprotein translocase subunit YajC